VTDTDRVRTLLLVETVRTRAIFWVWIALATGVSSAVFLGAACSTGHPMPAILCAYMFVRSFVSIGDDLGRLVVARHRPDRLDFVS
jgi:hypothetical protein